MKKKLSALFIILACFIVMGTTAFAEDVTVDGKKFTISENFSDEEVPEGFTKTDISYGDKTFLGIGSNDETTYKLYLVNEADPSLNGFYTYVGNGKFQTGSGIATSPLSITVETPEETTKPSGYKEKKIDVAGSKLSVYVPENEKEDESGMSIKNYLVYGTPDGTEHGWYIYDPDSNTAVKTSLDNINSNEDYKAKNKDLKKQLTKLNEKYKANVNKPRYLFLAMCVISMFFFFMMINAMIKRRHNRLDMEDRIIDLKLHAGEDTMKIRKGDLKKRRAADVKAMERNNISPSQIDLALKKHTSQGRNNQAVRRVTKSMDLDINELAENNKKPKKKATQTPKQDARRPKREKEPDFFDDEFVGSTNKKPLYKEKPQKSHHNMNAIDDIDFNDDLEFVSLDLDD